MPKQTTLQQQQQKEQPFIVAFSSLHSYYCKIFVLFIILFLLRMSKVM